ncbi:MAG: hypothetical protein AAF081_03850 [Actinomycetota bacterium]
MRRFFLALAAIALLASACSSTDEQFRDSLIDGGFTDEQADCAMEKLDEIGIDPESITDEALGDADPPIEAVEAVASCLLGDLDVDLNLDTDGDGTLIDAQLDEWYAQCEAGDGAACDNLYFQSPIGSEYEAFGNTCGNRIPEGALSCADELG